MSDFVYRIILLSVHANLNNTKNENIWFIYELNISREYFLIIWRDKSFSVYVLCRFLLKKYLIKK